MKQAITWVAARMRIVGVLNVTVSGERVVTGGGWQNPGLYSGAPFPRQSRLVFCCCQRFCARPSTMAYQGQSSLTVTGQRLHHPTSTQRRICPTPLEHDWNIPSIAKHTVAGIPPRRHLLLAFLVKPTRAPGISGCGLEFRPTTNCRDSSRPQSGVRRPVFF